MRKHEYKHVEKYNVDYRPLTHTEFTPTQILSKGMFTCIKENIFSFWHFWKVKILIPVNCSSTVKNVRKE